MGRERRKKKKTTNKVEHQGDFQFAIYEGVAGCGVNGPFKKGVILILENLES